MHFLDIYWNSAKNVLKGNSLVNFGMSQEAELYRIGQLHGTENNENANISAMRPLNENLRALCFLQF